VLCLCLEQTRHRRSSARPVGGFLFKLLLAGTGERVELCSARVFRLLPLGIKPSGPFKALQSCQQGAGIDLEYTARYLFHAPSDAKAVHRLQAERFKDQHVKRALDYVRIFIRHDDDNRFSNLDCQDVKDKMKGWLSFDLLEKAR